MFIFGDYCYILDKFLLNKKLIPYIIQDFTKRVKKLITTRIDSLKVGSTPASRRSSRLQSKHLRVIKIKRIAAC